MLTAEQQEVMKVLGIQCQDRDKMHCAIFEAFIEQYDNDDVCKVLREIYEELEVTNEQMLIDNITFYASQKHSEQFKKRLNFTKNIMLKIVTDPSLKNKAFSTWIEKVGKYNPQGAIEKLVWSNIVHQFCEVI